MKKERQFSPPHSKTIKSSLLLTIKIILNKCHSKIKPRGVSFSCNHPPWSKRVSRGSRIKSLMHPSNKTSHTLSTVKRSKLFKFEEPMSINTCSKPDISTKMTKCHKTMTKNLIIMKIVSFTSSIFPWKIVLWTSHLLYSWVAATRAASALRKMAWPRQAVSCLTLSPRPKIATIAVLPWRIDGLPLICRNCHEWARLSPPFSPPNPPASM